MKYLKLRIAWSVVWGVACLLLVALWVRSYSRWDSLSSNYVGFSSVRGTVHCGHVPSETSVPWWWWSSYSNPRVTTASLRVGPKSEIIEADGPGFVVFAEMTVGPMEFGSRDHGVYAPHWFLVVVMVILAAVPWIRLQFSLRTLLIGMTAAAIGLGMVVYALRQ